MMNPITWMSVFINRQTRNFRVLLLRKLGINLLGGLSRQYTSLYTIALGADPINLGTLNGIGSAISATLSMPMGRLMDGYSMRKVMLLAMIFEILVPLAYAVAQNWIMLIPALILFQMTSYQSLTATIENVYVAHSLKDEDRASGFGVSTVVSTIGRAIAPMAAACLVLTFGGITAEGIRPLFYIQLAGLIPLTATIYLNLTEVGKAEGTMNFLKDFKTIFEGAKGLKRFIFMECLGAFSTSAVWPFVMVFAVDIKEATPLILGYMGIAATLCNMIFSLPVGRLADRVGRKKTLYLMRPIMYASYLLIVLAPNAYWLILAWAFLGFPFEWMIWTTMSMEMVPEIKRGRWSGILMLFRNIVRIPAPIIGGILYQKINPAIIFLLPITIDLFLRLPVLITTPETLKVRSA